MKEVVKLEGRKVEEVKGVEGWQEVEVAKGVVEVVEGWEWATAEGRIREGKVEME